MDGFDLAVLGLPVAAFGVRVVTDYLSESQVTTDDLLELDPTTSGTSVDELVVTEGSIVDNVDDDTDQVPKTTQELLNDGYESELSCAKFLIKTIDPMCACGYGIKGIMNGYDTNETRDAADILEGNQVKASDDETVILSHSGGAPGDERLPVSSETEEKTTITEFASVSEDVHEADYESESDWSENDESDDESMSSEMFFSLINCSGSTTNTRSNYPNIVLSSDQLIPTQVSAPVNPCEADGVREVDPTIILPVNDSYQINIHEEIDQLPRDEHVNALMEACAQVSGGTGSNLYNERGRNDGCLYNNNDCPRIKAILSDSTKTRQLDQSRQERLHSQGRIYSIEKDTNIIHSVSESELSSEHRNLNESRSTSNLLLSDSSGNNSVTNTTKTNSLSNYRPTPSSADTTGDTTHNSTWLPVEHNTTERNPSAANSKHYNNSELTPKPADRHTPVFDHDSDMKVITDSSAYIDIPETPKSPTRQYTVACPVIEQASPKGKRCMKRMSLEISLVDSSPPLPLTSPNAMDSPDSRRQTSTENSEPETFKCVTKATISRRTGGESSITTAGRQQQEHKAPPHHPRGRFMYQFAVPRAYVRTVIGEQARVIRRLRQRTSATISVNYPRGFDGCTCTIEGAYSQVLGAVLILRQNFPLLDWSQDEPSEQT